MSGESTGPIREAPEGAASPQEATPWQRWLHRPETLWVHKLLFHAHQWVGLAASLYVLMMGATGSVLVYLPQVENSGHGYGGRVRAMEWLADLHENLLAGDAGRVVNGVGAISLTLVAVTGIAIWWPGTAHWRRSLSVSWKASFARLNWDLHNVLGFWTLALVTLWGVSGAYFCFPDAFNKLVDVLEPAAAPHQLRFGDVALYWLAYLHFGRFDALTRAVWAAAGVVLAGLAATGVVMYGHRVIWGSPSPATRARAEESLRAPMQ